MLGLDWNDWARFVGTTTDEFEKRFQMRNERHRERVTMSLPLRYGRRIKTNIRCKYCYRVLIFLRLDMVVILRASSAFTIAERSASAASFAGMRRVGLASNMLLQYLAMILPIVTLEPVCRKPSTQAGRYSRRLDRGPHFAA
jgi:hypothetical protein